MLKYNYINDGKQENLKSYKYVGTDKSLLYKYFLSKIANFCVDYLTPEWLAYLIFI